MVLKEAQISPQYLKTDKITVTILSVINPAHFVVKESPTLNASSEAKNFLEAEESMQKYYESVEPSFFQLPLKDTIIVVLYKKKFYRAKVLRILTQTAGHLFKVYLVDYGVECSVQRDCIYQIEKDFLDHPFQAIDIKLLGIEPISLVMNTTDLTMSYGPVNYWDPSAEIYVHDLVKGMCNAYIEVQAVEGLCIYGSLFTCFNDGTTKCINDELVQKSYARFDNSCWNKVHKIKDVLEGNISNKSPSRDESRKSSELNLNEMSSTSNSPEKIESKLEDFTMTFIRPSDGKVVAKSSFIVKTTPENLPESYEDELELSDDEKPKIVPVESIEKISPSQKDDEKPKIVPVEITEKISPSQKAIAQKKFQMLQKLNKKRRSTGSDHREDAADKCLSSSYDSTNLKEHSSSEADTSKLEVKMTNQDAPEIENNFASSSNNNLSNDIASNAVKVDYEEPEIKSKSDGVSQVQSTAFKKLQKLQELRKKRLSSSVSASSSVVQSPDTKTSTNSENYSTNISSPENKSSYAKSNSNKDNQIASVNSEIHQSQSGASITNCDNKKVSPQHCVSKDSGCTVTSIGSSKQECLSESQLLARKKFEKLQLLNKKRHASPVLQNQCQGPVNEGNSSSQEKLHNSLCGSYSDRTENVSVSLETVGMNSPDKLAISKDCDDVESSNLNTQCSASSITCEATELTPKKGNNRQVSRNLRTLEKLQQKVRLKKMKSPNPSSNNSGIMIKNSEQLTSDSCAETSPEKGSNLDQNFSFRHKKAGEDEKFKEFAAKNKKLTESSDVPNESNLSHFSTEESHSKTNRLCLESIKVTDNNASPVSTEKATPSKPSIQVKNSPSDKSLSHSECDDLYVSPMQPQQAEIFNELLAMSDSDDPLCSVSNKRDIEKPAQKCDIDENYIELSTQLKHSDLKLINFNELSLWEKQKVPALLIGIGLTQPIFNVEEAKFSKHICQVLKAIKFYGPSCIQSIIWPSMEKNRCMVAVAPPHSGKTVSYVLPLVSAFTEEKIPKPNDNGPSTIVLCSSWLKAQAVYDLFYFFLGDKKMNIITLCTDGGRYRNKMVSLGNRCDVLIATPHCLLQFLKDKSIKFDQLENFILDDSTALMNKHKKELKNILLHYKYTTKRNQSTAQLMLFAERWNKNFHIILDKIMSNPLIFFTSFLEAALFSKVSIFAHVCDPEKKKNTLLDVLMEAKKVVIFTTNMPDAMDVHHFLRCEGVRTFVVNEEMEHYIADEVIKDWKSIRCLTSADCLVITDQALVNMNISNADSLVHYDIPPESRLQFGNRFSCIAEHFQETKPTCTSHIIMTESDSYYAPQIVEIVENSGVTPSEELIKLKEKQDQVENTSGLLCSYFKAFGFCKERNCKDRHILDKDNDKPQVVPCEGDIQGLVTHIVDASHFYVRLLKYLDPVSNKMTSLIATYAEIGFLLRDFYSHASEEMKVTSPVVGESYVLAEENNLFYRVQVLKEINSDSSAKLASWKLLFLDEGWIKYYEKPELYCLSDQIKLPEPVAVEVYACNFATLDSCLDWNPQTSQLVSDFIKGKEIHAKIVLCLGKALWLDPVALVLHLSNTNEYVNLFNLSQKLIDCGHARQNKNHLISLQQACAGKIPLPRTAKPVIKKEEKVIQPTPEISYAFLECNTYEDVYVSSVVSPHHFYVQRAKFVECLDNLLDKINEQVEKKMLKKAYTVYKGMHCIAPFYEDDRYYRAVVTDVVSYTEVHLFFVDFGDSAKASRNNIYCLPAQFLLLPFQAIECELAGIAAAHGGWTDSSVDALTTLTRDEAGDMKILQLKAYSKSSCYEGGNHYVVNLWFNGKNISEQLLQAGFGIPAEVPIVEPYNEQPIDTSSEHSSDEDFDLNEKQLDSDEDMHPDDRDCAALFYGYVAEMVMQTSNLIPKLGAATISEVSSDDENHVSKSNESKLAADKICSDLMKLLPKIDKDSKIVETQESYSSSLRPLITWWDTLEQLSIIINLKDVKVYQLVVADEGLNFNTIIAGVQYCTEEKFYDKINSSDARKFQTAQGINIVAKKCFAFKWPRFTKEKKKFLHIKYDLIHIDDSDTDEPVNKAKNQLTRPEYVYDENSSSTDEDEKYVEPWKDFAQQKMPFSAFDG